ncbi:MAG: outer membrane beta-barrel protein [Gemmatimonadota bacterium]|jgi:hypothetical protein
MRRTLLLLVLALLVAPGAAEGQVQLLAAAGLTNPMSDLNDVSDVGYHLMGGADLSVATIPVSLRADGAYDSFGEQGGNPRPTILSGALSLVVKFPGVGLRPYVLGGVGIYRTTVDSADSQAASDTGIHGAFGVDIGALGFGGFAELRLVDFERDSATFRYVTAMLGLRL